jgi:type IV secretory pathway VirB9-like protein
MQVCHDIYRAYFLHYPSKETYMHSGGGNNQWVHSNNASSALTLQEIADAMSLTRERVRQIEAKAIRKLRQKMVELKIDQKDLLSN